ncbi:hypothetical protein MOTC310_17830 [Methylobacterium oryzae]|uniref:Uncharacterized protein n=2 Tax=Methylobacterium oryzae TaxID=334852 RepID=A0ABU7TQX8_9HYPH
MPHARAASDEVAVLHPAVDEFLDALARWRFARALAEDARRVDDASARGHRPVRARTAGDDGPGFRTSDFPDAIQS